jgi:hypothetical protein
MFAQLSLKDFGTKLPDTCEQLAAKSVSLFRLLNQLDKFGNGLFIGFLLKLKLGNDFHRPSCRRHHRNAAH